MTRATLLLHYNAFKATTHQVVTLFPITYIKAPGVGRANSDSRNYDRSQREKESVPRASIKPRYHERLIDYDSRQVQQLWEDCIELDICIDDPYEARTNNEYKSRTSAVIRAVAHGKRNKLRPSYAFDREAFRKAPYLEQKVLAEIYRFEYRMMNIHHSTCSECLECSMNISVSARDSKCGRCRAKASKDSYGAKNSMLPVWYDMEGKQHNEIPPELSCLTIAEILLIQRVSPLVPIVHIRNGTMGLQGHVCSFMQDINAVASSLPNLPSNVKAVKMVRTYKAANGDIETRTYMVNRERVMRALYWLVEHHKDYKLAYENGDLTIDPSNLDWMGDSSEMQLPTVTEMTRTYDTPEEIDGEVNYGVSKQQVYDPEHDDNSEMESSGMACSIDTSLTTDAQDASIRALKKAAADNPSISVLDWPQTSTEAVSEYDNTTRIFVNAFPHLYPGGIADINEQDRATTVHVTNWAKHLLLHADGRFARDPIWPFFAYNYATRQRNTQMGAYFVKSHISSPPRSIEQLQEQLRSGDSSFVNKIMFYTKRTRGTDAYWRHKRAELYNWIHYHIAAGNGAPDIFLTLSCAEYFWPDMIRLLEERVWISNGKRTDDSGRKCYDSGMPIDLSNNKAARNKAVNDYAIVVQEFFIARLEDWLNSIGRKILGIRHYWCRIEFAKGRGQIHAHLIAILDQDMMKNLQRHLRHQHMNSDDEAQIIGDWAEETFGLSATMNKRTNTDSDNGDTSER